MHTRERFHAVMNFQPFDRLPVLEWAPWWNKTIERWHTEGLPAAVSDRYDLYDYFGLEQYRQQWWFKPNVPPAPYHGAPVIHDMDEYVRLRDGIYYEPTFDRDALEVTARMQQAGTAVHWCTFSGFFWHPRTLFGIEEHLYAFYDEPELMHRMNEDILQWNLRFLDKVMEVCTPDFITLGEDMSYNHGPMLSKELFDEFIKPYYQRLIPVLRDRGIIPIVDSDGDVSKLAYWLEEVGVAGILPLERQAGVDIAKLRAEHPTMLFLGHYDKMVMDKGEDAMRAEFERLLPTARQGGFVIGVDHQTPPGVSLENYHIFLQLFREYAERAGQG